MQFIASSTENTFAQNVLVGVNAGGVSANPNALLVASLARGTYVYTTIAFLRQIEGAVPGSLRLLINVLQAGSR